MADIRTLDMKLIEDVFAMGGGYVLNFSDRTFAEFFAEELNIDIDAPCYEQQGTSKAKRLRCFLRQVEMAEALRALDALWRHRQRLIEDGWGPQCPPTAEGRFLELVKKLQAPAPSQGTLLSPGCNRRPPPSLFPPSTGTESQS